MKKLLLLFAVLLTALHASAYDFQVNGIYYNVISHSDMTCSVTDGDNWYFDSVTIPSRVTCSGNTFSVTSIGDDAFQYCSGLTSVEIPNSVTEIGKYAFLECYGLKSVEIPNSVTTIGFGAFESCSGLTSVVIPNSVTEIGNGAFCDCSSLTSFTGKFASYDHRCLIVAGELRSFAPAGLTSYEIPNSVTSIGNRAFSDCSGLTSVEIPNSVTSIGRAAFSYCSGLTSVEIPNSVTTIGSYTFNGCSGLTEITSLNTTPPSAGYDCFYIFPTSTCVLKVPAGSVERYKAAYGWQDFRNIVGIDVTGINEVKNGERNGGKTYTIDGREARKGQRGLVIENGRKILR